MLQWIGSGLMVVALSLAYLVAFAAKYPAAPAPTTDAARQQTFHAQSFDAEQTGDDVAVREINRF
jgi:hypothetical protein